MLQLLIVDDEEEILEWLKDMFDQETSEDIYVYTASSGKKAIEIMNSVKCDVVLTDIKMPGMDGLELYKHVKENWPLARVVFLTGYSSYETLYQIAQDKEVRYLVKTESADKIVSTVLEVYQELKDRQTRMLIESRKDALLDKAKYWLQKELIEKLLHGMQTENVDEEQLKALEMPFSIHFPVMVFLGRADSERGTLSYEQQEAMMFAIRENTPGYLFIRTYVIDSNYILGIVQPRLQNEATDWKRSFHVCMGMLENIQEFCIEKLKVQIPFALCGDTALFAELGKCYYLLRERLITVIGEQNPGVLKVTKGEVSDKARNKNGLIMIPMLDSYLEQGNYRECKAILREIAATLQGVTSMHDTQALELYYNMSMVYLKYINARGWAEKMPFYVALYPLTRVDDFADWNEAVEYLLRLTDAFSQLMEGNDGCSQNQAIERAERYIDNHLEEDLGLQVLADIAGFNASYFSRIFKQKNNCNISDYVTRERMNCARRLLVETDEKIYQIAEKTGYQTVSSFNRVFKKVEGISPAEYRTRNQMRE